MRISLNWLKEYVKIPEEVSDGDLISLIGSRLVEVEGVVDETHKYDGIIVVRVEKAEKIPETHLTLCQIYDGSGELTQVVCGAPNVRKGMLAVWIRPGAIVPASVHEDAPFVIGKRKMLGKYDSNGMLAGADELDFGDDHSGIVEIDPVIAKPGDALADIFELSDLILEIENKSLTHRPDTFGVVGFAREVAGILGIKATDESDLGGFRSAAARELAREPRGDGRERRDPEMDLSVAVDANICSRYTAVVLEKHGEIRKKYLTLQDTRLSKAGMKPIDPIVDATNYLMLLTGQPLHAFDLDKFIKVGKTEKPEIIVRTAKAGEKLVLLDGKEVSCSENDILITSNNVPVALAGAMGGESTMIDENTRNILIESATFSLYNLRKTQMAHGIFSEAITRFTKGQPPYQTLDVALKCAEMLSDGFKVTGIADNYPKPEKETVVKITTTEINNLLGTNYDKKTIIRTLSNVGFQVTVASGHGSLAPVVTGLAPSSSVVTSGRSGVEVLEILAPKWRTDIHIKEDIIEEVGRLLGYDNIEPVLPLHQTATKNELFELKRGIRSNLSKYGANEVLTYSFISEKLLEKAGQDKKNSYKIVNSISPELQYIRQSIVPSLLEKIYLNEKLPVEKFAIFEMNKVYQKEWELTDEKVPVESNSLGFVVAERKGTGTAFYQAKKYVAKLLDDFNIKAEFLPVKTKDAVMKPFEPKRTAEIFIDGVSIGVVGEFKNSVRNSFKLAEYLAGFEINLDLVLKYRTNKKELKFGTKKTEDLTITTTKNYAETLKEVQKKYPEAEISPLSIYQAEGETTKNISFRIAF